MKNQKLTKDQEALLFGGFEMQELTEKEMRMFSGAGYGNPNPPPPSTTPPAPEAPCVNPSNNPYG